MPQKTYRELSKESPSFLAACEKAGVPASKRQFSKFIQHRGLAWEAHISSRTEINN